VDAVKAYGEVEVLPNFLLTTAQLGAEWFISRPLYAGGKMFYTHSSRAWMWPRDGLDILEKRINLLHLPETEPRFLRWTARSLITIPTTLYISSYEINSVTEQTRGMGSPFSCNVAPRHWVIGVRRFDYSLVVASSRVVMSDEDSTLEGGTTTLSRNVGHQPPSRAATHPRITETSSAPLRKPKNSQAWSLFCNHYGNIFSTNAG
jgi:hypothetical protein